MTGKSTNMALSVFAHTYEAVSSRHRLAASTGWILYAFVAVLAVKAPAISAWERSGMLALICAGSLLLGYAYRPIGFGFVQGERGSRRGPRRKHGGR
jgi:hypothetical protein